VSYRGPERRAWPRYGVRADRPALSMGKLLPGRSIRVISISRGGALFESERSLRPGSPVEVQLGAGDTRQQVRGSIVRCWVSAMRTGHVRFRAALAFAAPLDLDEGEWRGLG
jgi:hypothetical protein